jgi:hypothetical protein
MLGLLDVRLFKMQLNQNRVVCVNTFVTAPKVATP